MRCPYCGGRTAIMQSRQRKKVFQRRHECFKCKQRFSTYEITTEEYKKLNNYKKICECLEREGLHCGKGKILFECKPILLEGEDDETNL